MEKIIISIIDEPEIVRGPGVPIYNYTFSYDIGRLNAGRKRWSLDLTPVGYQKLLELKEKKVEIEVPNQVHTDEFLVIFLEYLLKNLNISSP